MDLFLNLFGDDIEDLHITFPPESITTYKGLIKCLTDSFDPQWIVDFKCYTFNAACQRADESLDNVASRLCKLVTYCEFDKFDNKTAIIEGCHSTGFRMKILKETYTLDKILTMARLEARTPLHAIQMKTWRVLMMEKAKCMAGSCNRQDKTPMSPKEKHGRTCYHCGLEYLHVGACPAMGHKCRKCKCYNHFASICRGGYIKAERGHPARSRVALSQHAQHVEAHNCSSSTDSDAASTGNTNKRL
ncbi:hypothetical protein NDU88_003481 [Pleurodeles waltl]|uniref:Gag-like protein n=1 Tax=Pleurodeles waltl TaxID=8319 RepID=A0AAV7SG87_PLEWA|nr:hypothetical protein NDU88_003481 [Pleurodeles waltl]